jgi:uncharacterized protein (TIGR00730 family)
MNITVFLGSNEGNDPALAAAVQELGTWIAQNGHHLVYGGSRSGLMGLLAENALHAGGYVTGVEPQFFVDRSAQLEGLTELIVTRDMAERKAKLIALADVFVAFPGGTGTLEEIAEVLSCNAIGFQDKPIILYNLNGFYEGLRTLLNRMTAEGLSTPEKQRQIAFANDMPQLKQLISAHSK